MPNVALSLAFATAFATATAQSPLTTMFAANNGGGIGGAVYFDLQAATALSITQIDVNSSASGNGTLDVFTVLGGVAGNMGSSANWTFQTVLGSPVTLFGTNVPSPAPLVSPLLLPANQLIGMALVAHGFDHDYTNGNGANQAISTQELLFTAGHADNVPFNNGQFSPRVANVSIHYAIGSPGQVFATGTNYGTGCISQPGSSFYEHFPVGTFDLSAPSTPDNMSLVHTGIDYLAIAGIVTYRPPTANAIALALSDDSEATVTLSSPFPVGYTGSTSTLQVCSNGFISTASNGVAFVPNVASMLTHTNTGWYSWHDYDPGFAGAVWFEEVGGVAYITWDNVPSFGGGPGDTFQFQFQITDGALAAGSVSIIWPWISGSGGPHLVGFSAGGASPDPGPTDLSALLPPAITAAARFAISPLALASDARPIVNTTVNLRTSNMSPTTLIGGVVVGLHPQAVPIDLTSLGMPGCLQFTEQLFTLLFFPAGATSFLTPFPIPNMVSLDLQTQAFVYDPAGVLLPAGALASNATHLATGDW